MQYKMILEEYFLLEQYLFEDGINDIALEADTPTTTTTNSTPNANASKETMPKSSTTDTKDASPSAPAQKTKTTNINSNKLLNAIKELVDKIMYIIQKTIAKLRNIGAATKSSSNAFEKKLKQRQADTKPIQTLKITSYRYNDQFLNDFIAKMRARIVKLAGEIDMSSNPTNPKPLVDKLLTRSTSEMIHALSTELAGKDVGEISGLCAYLRDTYRDRKIERVYAANQIPTILEVARECQSLGSKMESYTNEVSPRFQSIKNKAQQLTSQNVTDEQRKAYYACANKAAKLALFYKTILEYVYQLKIERSINCRVIIQKFYRF